MNNLVVDIETSGGNAPVSVYATDSVITMPAGVTLLEVADELTDDQIGIVVLGGLGAVEGVVSERDVVRAVAEGRDPARTPAREVASTSIVWCDASATVRDVAEKMMEKYVRHVLLEDEGRLIGVVSARDLLGAYTMSYS